MNTLSLIIFMSLFWILFSQLNQLRSANEGCCGDKSCGKSSFDNGLWTITLLISIVLSIFVIYRFYELYTGSSMRARLFRKNPVKALSSQGAELMFGK